MILLPLSDPPVLLPLLEVEARVDVMDPPPLPGPPVLPLPEVEASGERVDTPRLLTLAEQEHQVQQEATASAAQAQSYQASAESAAACTADAIREAQRIAALRLRRWCEFT